MPAGVYEVNGRAPGYRCDNHQCLLKNITINDDILIGSAARSASSYNTQTDSVIIDGFSLSVDSDIELQHYCSSDAATDGFGAPANTGKPELYSNIWLRKLA